MSNTISAITKKKLLLYVIKRQSNYNNCDYDGMQLSTVYKKKYAIEANTPGSKKDKRYEGMRDKKRCAFTY